MNKVHINDWVLKMSDGDVIIEDIAYQRNGVSGEGFHQVYFTYEYVDTKWGMKRLVAILFDERKHVAVINPTDITDHWRGDNFEDVLRPALKTWGEANEIMWSKLQDVVILSGKILVDA